MSTETVESSPRQEHRMRMMRELLSELKLSQDALLTLNVESLESQNERVLAVCRAFRLLEPSGNHQNSPELLSIALQAQNVNRIQAALLRRAARSLEILHALRTRHAPTYAPPAAPSVSRMLEPRNT